MAAQRADVSILGSGARTHRPLAQIDLLEIRPRRAGVEIEQRALRDRKPDRAFDVAGGEVMPAFEAFIQAFEHAPRLFAAVAGAFNGDMIAALLRYHPEPPLDQGKILPVLAEQQGSEAIVLEGEHDLRGPAALGLGKDRSVIGFEAAHQASASANAACGLDTALCANSPNRL
jgi:hypothetical protein